MKTFPKAEWEVISPEQAGFKSDGLGKAKKWLDENLGNKNYRVVIIRDGRLVAEWYNNVDRNKKIGIASAAKSIYSNILGIAVAEGKIPSADAKVVDYYPEMMDVPEGEGPKEGRYVFEKDRGIGFRHLISNTSGYMKPGEEPGKVFHYQTYGMNILTHAIAKIYGLYDIKDPQGSPGFKVLIEEKIGKPIGAKWSYSLNNFALHEKARLNIFGYYCGVNTNALDLARVGWLWCNWGKWDGKQLIPEAWMRESVKTAPYILANCDEQDWKYGYGIWTNDNGKLWLNLPRNGFTASGAGGNYASVFPDYNLVIVQNPGLNVREGSERGNQEFLGLILDSLTGI